jgi:hypothetical protein
VRKTAFCLITKANAIDPHRTRTNLHWRNTTNQQPATGNRQPATSNQQPATSNQQPATSNQLYGNQQEAK